MLIVLGYNIYIYIYEFKHFIMNDNTGGILCHLIMNIKKKD